ncbi:MAG: LLM class flavin-dependent oxidoreductase [Chloroflexota bacterium]|nr:LLM class flavin-dependent oxidoreductase [Chloroflexota bacterium]
MTTPNATPVTYGWITQPAHFDVPAGHGPQDPALWHQLHETNEQLMTLLRPTFDTLWFEDHMGWGDKSHLECFTNMAYEAARNPGMRFGTLVAGQAFRNPGLLAKMALNMHYLSGNKFILGIGAGNNGGEHHEYGFEFKPNAERVQQLDEAIRVCRALWQDSPAHFHGAHYHLNGAFLSPLPESPIPIMVGGAGEKRTLRVTAELADWWCLDVAPLDVFQHKSRVLDAHCAAVGRDPQAILRAYCGWVSIADRSADAARWPNLHIVAGTPDEVTRELQGFIDAGVRHFMLRFMDYPAPGGLERFIREVAPRLNG